MTTKNIKNKDSKSTNKIPLDIRNKLLPTEGFSTYPAEKLEKKDLNTLPFTHSSKDKRLLEGPYEKSILSNKDEMTQEVPKLEDFLNERRVRIIGYIAKNPFTTPIHISEGLSIPASSVLDNIKRINELCVGCYGSLLAIENKESLREPIYIITPEFAKKFNLAISTRPSLHSFSKKENKLIKFLLENPNSSPNDVIESTGATRQQVININEKCKRLFGLTKAIGADGKCESRRWYLTDEFLSMFGLSQSKNVKLSQFFTPKKSKVIKMIGKNFEKNLWMTYGEIYKEIYQKDANNNRDTGSIRMLINRIMDACTNQKLPEPFSFKMGPPNHSLYLTLRNEFAEYFSELIKEKTPMRKKLIETLALVATKEEPIKTLTKTMATKGIDELKKKAEKRIDEPKKYAQDDLQALFDPIGRLLSESVSSALNSFPSLEKQKEVVELFKDMLGENPIGRDIDEINLFSKAFLSLSNDEDKYALILYARRRMQGQKDKRQVNLHAMSVALLPITEIIEEKESVQGHLKEIIKEKEFARKNALKAIRNNGKKLVSAGEIFLGERVTETSKEDDDEMLDVEEEESGTD